MNSLQNVASFNIRHSVRKSFGHISNQHSQNTRLASSSTEHGQESSNIIDKIVIPKRIERGPTDILKALASTVKRDYTAPHYKYHDDPFLIPTSNITRRMFAMSQESGRKAAQWILQEHADLFQHKVADPPIQAFFPRAVYDDKSEVNESVLQKVIAQHQVQDSLTIYGLLKQKDIEITRNTEQSLLELVCYYNAEDRLEEEWIEERWFRQGLRGKEKKMNSWKRGGVAEKIFQSLSPHDAASYSALLCGKAQFGDVDGAQKLYLEAMDAGFTLPVETYNKLISKAYILKESFELRWQYVEEMLAAMKQQGVSPDLGTLNAILETLNSMSTNKLSQTHALSIISEFKTMGIEPSLASYYFLFPIFCHERHRKQSALLISILNMYEGKSLEYRDPRDVFFFTEAMTNCRYHLHDIDVAYRLHKLLNTANNYNLIGDSYKESVYYRNFFVTVFENGTLNEAMELYNTLVPNIYVPEPGIMEVILKTVELNDASEFLPRLWSDLVMFEQVDKETLLCTMLTALQRSHSTDITLLNQQADVAWDIWQRVENQRNDRKNRQIGWTGQMLGDIVQVLLRVDRYSQALEIMTCLDQRQQEILGVPSIETLSAFLDKCIEKQEIKNAIWCIQYCSDAGYEQAGELAQKLNSLVELSELEKSQLVRVVGLDALKEPVASTS